MRFLQFAPGEFLFVSFKVAGYAGSAWPFLTSSYEVGCLRSARLTRRGTAVGATGGSWVRACSFLRWNRLRLVGPAPAALRFLVNYERDVVEPIWSIDAI